VGILFNILLRSEIEFLSIIRILVQKIADKLNKETVVFNNNVQHIQVQAGIVYQLSSVNFDAKKSNLIAKRIDNDLEVTLEEGVIVFDNYFSLCTTDLF
jgi:hypothetical protein